MYRGVIFFAVLAFIFLAPGELHSARIGTIKNSHPVFEDKLCPDDTPLGKLCVGVVFPNSLEDMMILTQVVGTSIYEGTLRDDSEVSVVLIDVPFNNKRMITFNSDNAPNCRFFDVDMSTKQVKCLRTIFNDLTDQNVTDSASIRRRRIDEGPIIPLGEYYPNGINVNVLFTFDTDFVEAFDGEDGISAEQHMEEVISIVKNAYKDITFKREIGTHVNIIAKKVVYDGSIRRIRNMIDHFRSSSEKDEFDLITYVTHPGSSGFAYLGTVCNKDGRRFSVNRGYGPGSCDSFDPPEPIDCTPTNRVMLTAETIAHEIGHNLGMEHDFDQRILDLEKRYEYREYNGEKCQGLMDYIDDGVGWSKCSMMDFSRYLTSGGTEEPCLGATEPADPEETSDEPISEPTPESCDGHQCGDGKCIQQSWVCDEIEDCDDRSDEENCDSSFESTTDDSGNGYEYDQTTNFPGNGHETTDYDYYYAV